MQDFTSRRIDRDTINTRINHKAGQDNLSTPAPLLDESIKIPFKDAALDMVPETSQKTGIKVFGHGKLHSGKPRPLPVKPTLLTCLALMDGNKRRQRQNPVHGIRIAALAGIAVGMDNRQNLELHKDTSQGKRRPFQKPGTARPRVPRRGFKTWNGQQGQDRAPGGHTRGTPLRCGNAKASRHGQKKNTPKETARETRNNQGKARTEPTGRRHPPGKARKTDARRNSRQQSNSHAGDGARRTTCGQGGPASHEPDSLGNPHAGRTAPCQ